MGFPTKNDNFEVFWGYHHLRKHTYAKEKHHLSNQKTLVVLGYVGNYATQLCGDKVPIKQPVFHWKYPRLFFVAYVNSIFHLPSFPTCSKRKTGRQQFSCESLCPLGIFFVSPWAVVAFTKTRQHLSHERIPGWLCFIGDYTTQLCSEYNKLGGGNSNMFFIFTPKIAEDSHFD